MILKLSRKPSDSLKVKFEEETEIFTSAKHVLSVSSEKELIIQRTKEKGTQNQNMMNSTCEKFSQKILNQALRGITVYK